MRLAPVALLGALLLFGCLQPAAVPTATPAPVTTTTPTLAPTASPTPTETPAAQPTSSIAEDGTWVVPLRPPPPHILGE